MFGLPIIDVMIGLIFVYLLLALVSAVVLEMFAGLCDSRTRNLSYGVNNLLGQHVNGKWYSRWVGTRANLFLVDPSTRQATETTVVNEFFNHPLVKSLREDRTCPSYIPPATFATVVIDIFSPADGMGKKDAALFAQKVKDKLPKDSDLYRTLLLFTDEAGGDMTKLKQQLESWFNDGMDRISAWYKNKTQGLVFLFAFILSFAVNADTIRLAKELHLNPAARNAVIAHLETNMSDLEKAVGGDVGKQEIEKINQELVSLRETGLTLGWEKSSPLEITLQQFIGILLTAMAVSLGAPFWFDILKKFMSIRAVGKSPEEKDKALTKDASKGSPAETVAK